jgi:hypothetical protein
MLGRNKKRGVNVDIPFEGRISNVLAVNPSALPHGSQPLFRIRLAATQEK